MSLSKDFILEHLFVDFELLLVCRDFVDAQHLLLLLQSERVDLLPQLAVQVEELLAQTFDVRVLLLQLRLRLLCDAFLNADDILENFDVLLEGARDLLILLQFFCQKHFYAAQSLQLGLPVLLLLWALGSEAA